MDDSVAPESPPAPPAERRVLGFVELTVDGIGTSNVSSTALAAPSLAALEELRAERDGRGESGEDVALDLSLPSNGNGSGDGTIQLGPPEGEQFIYEQQRYVHVTYPVRNAQLDGAAYNTPRNNLTFYAVSTSNTINGTAVRRLRLGDGSSIDPGDLALQILPTGIATVEDGDLTISHPDVLQVLAENEIGALDPPTGVNTVFPYGFVVRNPSTQDSRTLPASPAAGDFAGVVDFAFRIPVQQDPSNEPQSLSFILLAVDDTDVWLTESLEGQGAFARPSLRSVADELGATVITLLPGGTLPGVGGLRTLCTVRTAGTAGAPSAHLVNIDWDFNSFSPIPGIAVPRNSFFQANFDAPAEGQDQTTLS